MAISSIQSSLASLIDTTPLAQSASSTAAFAVPETSSAAAATTTGTATTANDTTLATDLATLLKALADGNVSDSQTALTQFEKDLGVSSATGDSSGQDAAGSSPLSTVLSAVSHLLSTGNTSGALQGLVGYLKETAGTQGSLFSAAA